MKTWMTRLLSMEPNQRNYWVGLLMLFLGLTFFASLALALVVVGGVMTLESVLTSYLAVWIGSRTREEAE